MVPAETRRSREARGLSRHERRRDSSLVPTASTVDARGVVRFRTRRAVHPRQLSSTAVNRVHSHRRAFFLSFLSRVRHFSLTDDACTRARNWRKPFVSKSWIFTNAHDRANSRKRRRPHATTRISRSTSEHHFELAREIAFFPETATHEARATREPSSPRPRRRPFGARLRERVATHIAFAAGDEPVIPPELSATTPRRGVLCAERSRPDRASRSRTRHEQNSSPRWSLDTRCARSRSGASR